MAATKLQEQRRTRECAERRGRLSAWGGQSIAKDWCYKCCVDGFGGQGGGRKIKGGRVRGTDMKQDSGVCGGKCSVPPPPNLHHCFL